jgi:hypothetical protein
MISAALCAWQACYVLDGIAQRHKWPALTWYWNRLEKFEVPRHSAPYACRLGMKRRAVAGYLFDVVVNRAPETFMGEASCLGFEN